MIKAKYIIKKKRNTRMRKTIRKVLTGDVKRPRMIVFRSNKYLYSQVYDDVNGKVLTYASTLEKEVKSKLKSTKDKEAAKVMGEVIAERLKKLKIKEVVFDRNVYSYTGRVKVFADSAREKGIKF
ncbi:MAG: 50S ribosomal protein L18 [Acidobacteriota bacterium]